jgi:hypothetical protein
MDDWSQFISRFQDNFFKIFTILLDTVVSFVQYFVYENQLGRVRATRNTQHDFSGFYNRVKYLTSIFSYKGALCMNFFLWFTACFLLIPFSSSGLFPRKPSPDFSYIDRNLEQWEALSEREIPIAVQESGRTGSIMVVQYNDID